MADMTHILHVAHDSVSFGPSSPLTPPHQCSNSRDRNTPLPRIPTVQLHPRVVHRVVAHREGVDRRPQPPPRPPPDVRVHLSRDDERDEEAHLRQNDRRPAPVRPVAEVREDKDDEEGEEGADGGEGVG